MYQITKAFMRGVPETSPVWDAEVPELHSQGVANNVRLSPQGFGVPIPADLGATVAKYRDWFLGELAQIDSPIDVVAHDQGAGMLFAALGAESQVDGMRDAFNGFQKFLYEDSTV